jgi:hypothetical protein
VQLLNFTRSVQLLNSWSDVLCCLWLLILKLLTLVQELHLGAM